MAFPVGEIANRLRELLGVPDMTKATNATKDSLRNAAYVRCSDGDGSDYTRQVEGIEEYTNKEGIKVAEWYKDIDGRNPRDLPEERPEFQRMLRDADRGKIGRVIVFESARFGTAGPNEFGFYVTRLLRGGVAELVSVREGLLSDDRDPASAYRNLSSSIGSSAAQRELGFNTISGKRTRVGRGEWQGGYVPYGFDVECVDHMGKHQWRVVIVHFDPKKKIWKRKKVMPDGTEIPFDGKDNFPGRDPHQLLRLVPSILTERIETMRDVFRRVAAGGWTIRGLCTHLNKLGVHPVYGDGWYSTRLTPMLRNPVYYLGATVWNKNSHGRHQEFKGGKYVAPEKRAGKKPKAGRKHPEEDWTFPAVEGTGLIDKELFDKAQEHLAGSKKKKPNAPRSADLYLSGLVYCGRCGEKMVGRNQFGTGYVCQNYIRLGKQNLTGCQLHRVLQADLEAVIGKYLDDSAKRVEALIDSSEIDRAGDAISSSEAILFETHERMRQYLRDRGKYSPSLEVEGEGLGLRNVYEKVFAQDTGDTAKRLAKAEADRERQGIILSAMENLTVAAMKPILEKIKELDELCVKLKEELYPLTEKLEAVYADLQRLDEAFAVAKSCLDTDAKRDKGVAIRKVIGRIVVHCEHFDHVVTDPRSKIKGQAIPRYRPASVDIQPVFGDMRSFPTSIGQVRG